MNPSNLHAEASNAVHICEPTAAATSPHIIVIGAGPAGVRVVHEVLKRQPNARITLFGNEPYLPYNRVQLSALLAGDIAWDEITSTLPSPAQHPNFQHLQAHIQALDIDAKAVIDRRGNRYSYDRLVLATGSRPHVPHIPGVAQTGVYTFRSLHDAEALYGRVARARHVVVVGGGLLGLEAARALQRARTQVTVIQQGPRLMNRQLDARAAAYLQDTVSAQGISVVVDSGVRQILGDGRVTGVLTRDGVTVVCDTVLLCAGIRPALELARDARLKITTGILVDDRLQTSANDVFAIGECCEHRGKTYGLVNPGFEQAAVCADVLCSGSASYAGSLEVSRLKVLGETVCSMGEVADIAPRPFLREWTYNHKKARTYRKLVTFKGRIVGAVGFGDWAEIRRLQEAYQNNRRLYPWQALRFRFTGRIWSAAASDHPNQWPASTVICQCNNISQGDLTRALSAGATTVAELGRLTGAGTVCGSCKPLLAQLVGHEGPREKEKTWATLALTSVLAALGVALIAFAPALQVADSVQHLTFPESLWNNKFWKQVTGFTLLGLATLGLLMSLRKRIKSTRLGDFAYWRALHVVLGVACALLLMVHTGLHLGENLNQWLMLNFLSVLGVGALAGGAIAQSHRLHAQRAQQLRRFFTWAHILVVWPLPILLAVHIFTVYYF